MFGSIARAEEHSRSDVDLIIVGTATMFDISGTLHDARHRLAREVNPIIYTPEEFAKRLAERNHFLLSVMEKPKLFIFGTPDDLEPTHSPKLRRRRANK